MSANYKKMIARESEKVLKARIRLVKRIAALNAQVTKKAIQDKSLEIHQWISRHSNQRTPLRLKHVSMFDKNQNSAPTSKIVENALKRMGALANMRYITDEVVSK
jgi:hypothetical protein